MHPGSDYSGQPVQKALRLQELQTGDQKADYDPSRISSTCGIDLVAAFLLAVERGAFLGCNGWDDSVMGRPLGHPSSAIQKNQAGTVLNRSFSTGTSVTWDLTKKRNQGTIHWAK